MDAFVSRKRRRASDDGTRNITVFAPPQGEVEEDSTDIKLATLSSLHPDRPQDDLLEVLLGCEGSVGKAIEVLSLSTSYSLSPQKRKASMLGVQSSLLYALPNGVKAPTPVQKGRTLHLYSPEDVAAHTPCSIVHNFLPAQLANDLLAEILPEVSTYTSATFKLFDNVVQSPHTACFYVTDRDALNRQKQEYLYNGSNLSDIRELLPTMRHVSSTHIRPARQRRNSQPYSNPLPIRPQTPLPIAPTEWQPNAAFVNCYDGARPIRRLPLRPTLLPRPPLRHRQPISRRRTWNSAFGESYRLTHHPARPTPAPAPPNPPPPAPQQIPKAKSQSTSLTNSLLIMHAEMQEEWKHAITPALTITPHPIAGNKRIRHHISLVSRGISSEVHAEV